MSTHCAHIRRADSVERVSSTAIQELATYWKDCRVDSEHAEEEMLRAVFNYDLLVAQAVYAAAMADAIRHGIGSRGSYMVVQDKGQPVHPGVALTYVLDDGAHDQTIQETSWNGRDVRCHYRPIRPLPDTEQWFEKVYNGQG